MRLRDYQDMMKEIWEKYNENPTADWKVFVKGNPSVQRSEIFISDGVNTYYIQTFPYSPEKITGRGIKMEKTPIEKSVPYTSGIRVLDRETLRNLMEKGKISHDDILRILKTKTVSEKEIMDKKAFLIGPTYLISEDKGIEDLADISSSQRELVRRISRETDELERRYLDYIG